MRILSQFNLGHTDGTEDKGTGIGSYIFKREVPGSSPL